MRVLSRGWPGLAIVFPTLSTGSVNPLFESTKAALVSNDIPHMTCGELYLSHFRRYTGISPIQVADKVAADYLARSAPTYGGTSTEMIQYGGTSHQSGAEAESADAIATRFLHDLSHDLPRTENLYLNRYGGLSTLSVSNALSQSLSTGALTHGSVAQALNTGNLYPQAHNALAHAFINAAADLPESSFGSGPHSDTHAAIQGHGIPPLTIDDFSAPLELQPSDVPPISANFGAYENELFQSIPQSVVATTNTGSSMEMSVITSTTTTTTSTTTLTISSSAANTSPILRRRGRDDPGNERNVRHCLRD